MKFWIKTHPVIKWLFPKYVWDFKTTEKLVWLTFDDGPIPEVTPWVLEQLQQHNAQATFFCIGDNVGKHSQVLHQVIDGGHSIGNHTFNHLDGWKTATSIYLDNVAKCDTEIARHVAYKKIMRPPYGKISRKQASKLLHLGYKIIMWDVVSADFDEKVSVEECLENVLQNVRPGSIIVFHDSIKAFKNLEYALPKTLEFLKKNGYRCVVPF